MAATNPTKPQLASEIYGRTGQLIDHRKYSKNDLYGEVQRLRGHTGQPYARKVYANGNHVQNGGSAQRLRDELESIVGWAELVGLGNLTTEAQRAWQNPNATAADLQAQIAGLRDAIRQAILQADNEQQQQQNHIPRRAARSARQYGRKTRYANEQKDVSDAVAALRANLAELVQFAIANGYGALTTQATKILAKPTATMDQIVAAIGGLRAAISGSIEKTLGPNPAEF